MDISILELIGTIATLDKFGRTGYVRDFASESALGFIEDILGGNFDLRVRQVFLCSEEINGGRGDDDLDGRIKFCSVEVLNQCLCACKQAVCSMVSVEKRRLKAWGALLILKFCIQQNEVSHACSS